MRKVVYESDVFKFIVITSLELGELSKVSLSDDFKTVLELPLPYAKMVQKMDAANWK